MVFKKGNIPWNKGLTKEDPRVKTCVNAAAKHNKSRIPWNKGLTKETDKRVAKISKTLTGRSSPLKGVPRPKKVKDKIREALMGREFTEEWKNNISESKMGTTPWNKGLTKETDNRIAKYAETLTNREFTDEHIKNLRKARLSLPKSVRIEQARYAGTISMSKLTKKERIRRAISACQSVSKDDTQIEKLLEKAIIENEIDYQKQKGIGGITITDFFILPNICVYADGNYWHNYPEGREADRKINNRLKKRGYQVLRFWGSEIREHPEKCIEEILETIDS